MNATPEFLKQVAHALAVVNNPKWREFDKSTLNAAQAILMTAMRLGVVLGR